MPRPQPPLIAPPSDGHQRYRMVVAYDGSAFHGFAPNPGVATVGGSLAEAMRRILGAEPRLTCAGRTDTGVHGWGQVVSFDAAPLDPAALQKSLNAMCAPAIVVRELDAAAPDFDARFSAASRTYRYRVLNQDVPDPFLHATTWHITHPLDLVAMNRAGQDLVGEHDFSSFCRRRVVTIDGEATEASLVRDVLSVDWRRVDGPGADAPSADLVELWITATAFCHQMVRSITGTLVDVGRGRIPADAVPAILAASDRSAAGPLAPPQGLTLWQVGYP